MKTLKAFALLAGLAPLTFAVAGEPNLPPSVIELVDLSCPHCASVREGADRVAREVRAAGGVFRVSPVGPAIDKSDGAASVRMLWCLDSLDGDESAQEAAGLLYEGYQGGARLDDQAGVSAWLTLHGLSFDSSRLDTCLSGHQPELRMAKALRIARLAGVSKLPAFVILTGDGGHVATSVEWRESASDTLAAVEQAWQSTQVAAAHAR